VSQSPLEAPDEAWFANEENPYRKNWSWLNALFLSGRSWSGNERNCSFLNLGGNAAPQFANISAVAGFDFAGDGRALATTDWDQDGDLDLWLTNRTGPRVQMLRNDSSTGHHFLAVRLEGNGHTVNRDAIGARVEVVSSEQLAVSSEQLTVNSEQSDDASAVGSSNQKLIKTLRAGEGYLSQSGKWLHFGLGTATDVEKLIVRWPDGGSQEFANIECDRFYRIVQDVVTAHVWSVQRPTVALPPADVPGPCAGSQANLSLSSPMPLPALTYETFDGDKASLRNLLGRPVVVCLWASWCPPCLVELAEFARREKELRAAGLEVVALSVDELGDDTTDARAAPRALAKLKFPFHAGQATAGLVEKIHFAHLNLFRLPQDLPVPTSLLIDPEGRLAAVYRGRVEVERLVADAGGLSQKREVLPLEGRWFSKSPEQSLSPLVRELFKTGYVSEAIEYMTDNNARLREEPNYEKLLSKAGIEQLRHGKARAAVPFFREAIDVNPDYIHSLNNLAYILATHRDADLRDGDKAIHYARRAVRVAGHRKPDVLGTLAAAYAEAGRFEEAVVTAEEALRLARESGDTELTQGFLQELDRYRNRQPVRME
jgi:peroxiredoxin